MCRHLAYLGPPRTVEDVVLAPPHSLLRQSHAPRDMRGGGTLNADGYGIAWYPPGRVEPVRHRRTGPIWADEGLPTLARHARASAVLAAVRSATVGMPVVETATAPFVAGRWSFSHNGVLPGWPDTAEPLAATLSVRDLMTLQAPTDSALLWTLLLARLRSGEDAAKAVTAVSQAALAAVPDARLNLLLCDGETVVATACYHALWLLTGDDQVALASEPWDDDPRWTAVPDRHLVAATIGTRGPDAEVYALDGRHSAVPGDENGDR